jgi:hypothetical protein
MTKPFYKSQTINAAIIGYLILVANTGLSLYNPDTGEWRAPNQAETAAILTGAGALYQTIEGRKKATEKIGNPMSDGQDFSFEPAFVEEVVAIPPDNPDLVIENSSVDNEEDDYLDIKFSELTGKYYLVAQVDTKLKTSPTQSNELVSTDYREVGQWQKIDIDGWKFLAEKNEHIEVRIDEFKDLNSGIFYVYAPHFKLFNILGNQVEIESPSSPIPVIQKDRGKSFSLPGNSSLFYTKDPIYSGSHFTWGEATKNGTRIPTSVTIVNNIIKQAKELDKLRAYLGDIPLVVTSWYRDPKTNAVVGGAANSSHLTGLATDIISPAISPLDLQRKILNYWKVGGIGKAANKANPFVHVASDGWYRTWYYG